MAYLGGCFCGEIRFRSDSEPVEKGYCHCSICRKTTGAPVLAFASFRVEGFTYTKGEPKIFKSSSRGQREFCGTCGTQICFRESEMATTVDVNSGALDEPDAVAPDHHIYTSSRLEWLRFADQLPEHQNELES
ncbi:MAG: GFA family protein [Halioglobus sp.]